MWWSGWSWRTRAGWILLGLALLVVCVALPGWALASGDLTEVAGWANILALPVTALGVVLVYADRDRVRAVDGTGGRRPWMAPPLDRMVPRPELGGRLVASLVAPGAAEVGLTTGLHGAGGFGKTRLATWVCHRPEIDLRYPGGLLWVTVGQEVRGADLAVRINDLAFALDGQRPAISDPVAAGAELGRLLDQRGPVLLVVDDVWEESQLGPFRIGGQRCTRLVTTRIPDLFRHVAPQRDTRCPGARSRPLRRRIGGRRNQAPRWYPDVPHVGARRGRSRGFLPETRVSAHR